MNYYFTGILIVLMTLLAFCVKPAHSKNEYLNDYGVRCGEFEVRTDKRETDYNYSDSSTNEQQYLSFTYRKYLGTDCKTACLLYTSPSPRDGLLSRMPSSA